MEFKQFQSVYITILQYLQVQHREMQDYQYVRIQQNLPKIPTPKLLILGYASQLLLYIAIVIYCVLSPSLFSTIALMFMLVSFATMIATPYYVVKTNESVQSIRIVAYPIQRVLWSIFLAINLGEFIFKLVFYLTGQYNSLSGSAQQFLQLQSLLYMFLPLILLPFIAGTLIVRTKTRKIEHFKYQINKQITVPIFLFMGILILLIQIFSISVAGFSFFICMMILFIQRKLDFSSFFSWVLVILVQLLCLIFIGANFMTTTRLLSYYSLIDKFQFYGINGLNQFTQSSTSRGYIICLILLLLVSCFVQRIFAYNIIWLKVAKLTDSTQVKQQDIFMQQGVYISKQANKQSRIQEFNQERPRLNKRYSLQQYELQHVMGQRQVRIQTNTVMGSPGNLRQSFLSSPRRQSDSINYVIQQDQNSAKKNKRSISKLIFDNFLFGINKFVDFIYSTQFSLRFSELISIIVIQRYNNIYSFVAVIWLAIVASTQNIRVIYFITLLVLLPVEVGNYVILYAYNAAQSPIPDLEELRKYGFQVMQLFWLDIIIFNVYLFYLITFLLAASRNKTQKIQRKSLIGQKSNLFILIVAFVFRYSYLLTIIAIFVLGFSKVNLINLIYITLFLVFLSSGQNVIVEVKNRNNKTITCLTTFSRKYWFLIVYFTLFFIVLKYTYFLFFAGQWQQSLQPTGINQKYNWSFNFSLSDICISNTTPLFIIFILSEAQIIIYRSAIYLNYSFSLMSQITDIKNPRKNNFRVMLNKIAELFLQFYYQSLFYISGIIIVTCCYRWNFFNLFILILTCYGLLRGFNRLILALIVFIDLSYIIINYLVLFTTYQVAQDFLGEEGIKVVNEISLFLGLTISSNTNLISVFILSIVIFYFGVESFGLMKILLQNRFNQQLITRYSQNLDDQGLPEQNKVIEDTISSYQPTVLEEELNDLEFANNFNKNVIIGTKRMYNTVLWKKYTLWFSICRFLAIFFTDIITIFVFVCCLSFRLSLTMFYFLLLYILYFLVLFDRIGLLMEQEQFYIKIERQFQCYRSKQSILSDRQNPRSFITGQEATQSVINFIIQTKIKAINLRHLGKQKLWFLSTIVVFFCVVLNYSAQFMSSQFYNQYLDPASTLTQNIQNVLFVIGISVTNQTSFFRQVYFYYFMLIMLIIQRLVIRYVHQKNQQQNVSKQSNSLSRKQYKSLQDPMNFIDENCNFIESIEIKSQLQSYQKVNLGKQQQKKLKQKQIEEIQYLDCSKQSNLLIFFQFKGTLIKVNYVYGFLMVLLRFYLLMMLINLYQKSNVFAFFYLFSVLFFWFKKLHFSMVKDINKIAIIILLLQYLMLLLDITNKTSPLILPYYPDSQNLSLLQRYITSQKGKQWISYLVLNFNKKDGNSYFVSFFISAIIVFLTELYFTMFFFISQSCIQMIQSVYNRYDYIDQNLQKMPDQDTIYLNYQNYKSWTYRFSTLSYQLLINNSYIVVSYLILLLLSGVFNYLCFGLVLFAQVYIYLGIFTGLSEDKNIYTYTRLFFKVVQLILFLVLLVVTISQIPVFPQQNNIIITIEQLSNISQIFLIFLIQIWLDLSVSQQFKEATQQYDMKVKNRQDVMIKCIAYQQNRDVVQRMLHRYKEVMWFEINLRNALDIIDEWHKAMYKKKIVQFDSLRLQKVSSHTKIIQQQIKKQIQQRPQQEKPIYDIFVGFMKKNTSVALQSSYYQITKYILINNHRLVNMQNANIDIWDYVLENYEKLSDQIKQSQQQLQKIIKIIENQELGDRIDKLQIIKKQQYSEPKENINQMTLGSIKTPKKIFIDIKPPKDNIYKIVLGFIMSNFSYFLSFFLWIYYLVNPCLLSLPFIVYFFAFEIIANRKLTSLILIYIFAVILVALFIQIQQLQYSPLVKYFFFSNGNGQYTYATDYLFFVFILIFINEQIKRYQGNKFKQPHDAESRILGIFRMLINQDTNSNIYLWNLKAQQSDYQYEQKQQNPMEFFSKKIETNPEELTSSNMPGFFQSFTQGKTGIDLYPYIASIQIFLTIYIIFLYPYMTQSQSSDLQQSFKYFQFSSEMVIGVLVHVGTIVMQRKITLISYQNPNKSKIKYFYTMTILCLLMIFIYYIAPTNQNVKGIYQPTPALMAFTFFYFFYFFLSAIQIRYGYKKYKSLNSVMKKRAMLNNLVLTIFTTVPFLYELKLMMDYSFCQTSLQFFDWFRLFSIYLNAYKAKIQYYTSTGVILGSPQAWTMKIIGWAGFIIILFIIFGPMILFSGLNPIAQSNLVVGGALQMGIQIQNGNYFGLYSTSHFSLPPSPYTPQQFWDQNFQQVPALQILSDTDIPQQFQFIQFQPYSDSNWAISSPNFISLNNMLTQAINQLNNNKTPTYNFSIVVKYQLNRRVTEVLATDSNFQYPTTGYLNVSQLQSLSNTFTQCNVSTYLPNFYISLIRLYTIGNTYKPRPIVYTNSSGINPYYQGIYLTLYCDNTNTTTDTNNVFWGVNSTNTSSQNPIQSIGSGIFLNVLCDKYQNLIAGLGFTALYTSVILVVAGFIRGQFQGNLPQLAYQMNPKPDNIIQISEAIGTLRDRKQFKQQYLMYFQLIDIIRSPDLMKYLSGSYPALIQQADQKRRRKEENKQLENRKGKIQ